MAEKEIAKSAIVTENGQLGEMQAEAERQEISLRMAEVQAKIAQEIAIAHRIENAAEVEIEEFYDYSGERSLGAKTDGKVATLGLRGAGKRVSRRVYRFIGWQDIPSGHLATHPVPYTFN